MYLASLGRYHKSKTLYQRMFKTKYSIISTIKYSTSEFSRPTCMAIKFWIHLAIMSLPGSDARWSNVVNIHEKIVTMRHQTLVY